MVVLLFGSGLNSIASAFEHVSANFDSAASTVPHGTVRQGVPTRTALARSGDAGTGTRGFGIR